MSRQAGEVLYRVDAGFAVFGFVAMGQGPTGRVVRAAPIAAWMVGRGVPGVVAYWHGRGATVVRCPPPSVFPIDTKPPEAGGMWG